MAKANGINKRLLAKKDMNFFAEFTANAAKAARMLGYGVAAGFLVVFVVLTFIVAFFIRNSLIKAEINRINNLLAGPEYTNAEIEAAELTEELNKMTNKYYSLTQMRNQVDSLDPANTNLADVIAKCIPNDTIVLSYAIDNSTMSIEGQTFTYYSPVDMINMLNSYKVFAIQPQLKISRVPLETEAKYFSDIYGENISVADMAILNNYYHFNIDGTLVGRVHISISRYLETGEAVEVMGGIESQQFDAGSTIEISDIGTYTYGGTTYTLSKIYVDGVEVEPGSFAGFQAEGKYVDVARKNMDIKFYYSAGTAGAAETTAEG